MCNLKFGKTNRSKFKDSVLILHTIVMFCIIATVKSNYSDESDSDDDEQNCIIAEPSLGTKRASNFTDVLSLIKEGKEFLKLDGHSTRAILILGNTDVGKKAVSLTINGDLSKLHIAKTSQNNLVLIDEDNLIGPSLTSKAFYPHYIVNPKNNLSFYYCPGFSDIRGVEEDVATMYFIKAVTEHLTEAKFLLVAKHSDITFGDQNRFLSMTKHVARLLKNTGQFNHSLGLVVTRVNSRDSDGRVIKSIGEQLNSALQSLKDHLWHGRISEAQRQEITRQIIIVEKILVQRTNSKGRSYYPKIAILRAVTKCGPFDEKPEIFKARNKITRMYSSNLQYAQVTPPDFGFTLKDSASEQVRAEMIPKLKNQIEEHVKNISDMLIIQCFLNQTATFVSTLETVTKNLTAAQKPSEYLHQLATSLSLFSGEEETSNLKTEENLILFYVNISHHTDIFLNNITKELVENFQSMDKFKEKFPRDFILQTREIHEISRSMSKLIFDQFLFTSHARFPEIEDIDNFLKTIHLIYKTINDLTSSTPSDLIQSLASIFGETQNADNWGNLQNLEKLLQSYLVVLKYTAMEMKRNVSKDLSDLISWYENLKTLMSSLRHRDAIVKIQQASLYNLHTLPVIEALEILVNQGIFHGDVNKMKDLLGGGKLDEKDVQRLKDILKYFTSIRTSVECYPEHGLVIKGRFVQFEDFIKNECATGRRDKVVVLSSDSVIFDQDFQSNNVESLVVLAPYWEVIGKRELTFSGKDAENYPENRPFLGDYNGRPGRPGEPGGSFYGANKFGLKGGTIVVRSVGGEGGRGERGLAGRNKVNIGGSGGFPGSIEVSCGNHSCDGVIKLIEEDREGVGDFGLCTFESISGSDETAPNGSNCDRILQLRGNPIPREIPPALNYSMFMAMYSEFLNTQTDASKFARDFASELNPKGGEEKNGIPGEEADSPDHVLDDTDEIEGGGVKTYYVY